MNRAKDSTAPGSTFGGAAVVLAVIAFAAYFIALHALIVDRSMPTLVLAMIVGPWIVASTAMVVKRFEAMSGVGRVAIAVVAIAVVLAIVRLAAGRWPALVRNTDVVLYLENVLFFGWLSTLFATSLRAPGEALVTRMARRVRRGDMPPEVVRYTRRVTAGWAVFFASTIAVSSLLFFGGNRDTWSLFVNLLIWPLVVVGFIAEYAIRLTVLRHVKHVPLMSGVHAFRERDALRETESHR